MLLTEINNLSLIDYSDSEMQAIIFDSECTGFNEGRIIEAAWIPTDIKKDQLPLFGVPFSQRYNPGKPIDFGALNCHHILDDDLQYSPSYTTFNVPDKYKYIIAHNADHDFKYIPNAERFKPICTLAIARKLWPDVDSHQLGAMIYFLFGKTKEVREALKNAHSTLSDCIFTYHLLQKILEKEPKISSLDELFDFSEMAKITTVKMPFGKYKNMLIVDIQDKSYLKWMTEQKDMDERLVAVARKLI